MTIKEKAKTVVDTLNCKDYGLTEFPSLAQKTCTCVCPYCKQEFEIFTKDFYERLFLKKFLKEVLVCKQTSCKRLLKQRTIQEQTRLGQTSAKGHKPSSEQIAKWQDTLKKNGSYDKIVSMCKARKGKSFEELYGPEKSLEIREKIKRNTPNIQPNYEGKRARDGHEFSEESKRQISKSLKEFYSTEEGKEIRKIISDKIRISWYEKTDDERLSIIKRQHQGQEKIFEKNSHAGWGYIKAWYEDSPTQPYRSSWEQKYFEYLNLNRVFYKSNKILYLKYKHPDGHDHFYIPDVLIFEDRDFKHLKEIQEIKPSVFLEDPVNVAKFSSAKKFCQEKGVTFTIITELELRELGIEV